MKVIFGIAFGLLLCAQVQASSVCRNATNTVIYKTTENSAQLLVGKNENSGQRLVELDLSLHEVTLLQRESLGLRMEGQTIVSTSSVNILVTKKDGARFDSGFMHLISDGTAIRSIYICETRELIEAGSF